MSGLIRRLSWRIGRRVYVHARGDVQNDPSSNGEYDLVRRVIQPSDAGVDPVFLDVGANRGNWSAEVLQCLARRGVKPVVHAFEPCLSTYLALRERFANADGVSAHHLALGESKGTAELSVVAPMGGTNTLSSRQAGTREQVRVDTVDEFLVSHAIDRVRMIKSDTEGFDFSVMKGARAALRERRVDLWQFEYNWRWIDNRSFLRDVFDLADESGYAVGRLLPGGGIELYETWHPELERFFEANFCMVLKGCSCETLCSRCRFNRSNVAEPVSRG